jgi:hypothetical protein
VGLGDGRGVGATDVDGGGEAVGAGMGTAVVGGDDVGRAEGSGEVVGAGMGTAVVDGDDVGRAEGSGEVGAAEGAHTPQATGQLTSRSDEKS